MKEKLKVSHQVAEALRTVLPNGNISACIEAHVDGWTYEPKLPLNMLTTEEFARCCLIGYEVVADNEKEINELQNQNAQLRNALKRACHSLGADINDYL